MRMLWCVLVVLLGSLALAAEPGNWDALVKKRIEAYESVKRPVPTAYPWLAKRLKTLFGVRGVGHVQVFGEADGKRRLLEDIYYKAGEVHVINRDKGWSLITRGKEAYEWQDGGWEGLITKLTDEDLIDYLMYLTDPSDIMASLYEDAIDEPGSFLRPKEVGPGLVERRFKKPVDGFRAVFVSEDPAWLCGVESDSDRQGGKPVRMIVSKPESLKEVPAGVFEQLKGVEFKKSDLSIRRHMVYL